MYREFPLLVLRELRIPVYLADFLLVLSLHWLTSLSCLGLPEDVSCSLLQSTAVRLIFISRRIPEDCFHLGLSLSKNKEGKSIFGIHFKHIFLFHRTDCDVLGSCNLRHIFSFNYSIINTRQAAASNGIAGAITKYVLLLVY